MLLCQAWKKRSNRKYKRLSLPAVTCATASSQGDAARTAEGSSSSAAPPHGASPPPLTALPPGPAQPVGPATATQAPRTPHHVCAHLCYGAEPPPGSRASGEETSRETSGRASFSKRCSASALALRLSHPPSWDIGNSEVKSIQRRGKIPPKALTNSKAWVQAPDNQKLRFQPQKSFSEQTLSLKPFSRALLAAAIVATSLCCHSACWKMLG